MLAFSSNLRRATDKANGSASLAGLGGSGEAQVRGWSFFWSVRSFFG